MKNVIHDYAWGSPDAIPKLLGYNNEERIPQAELWMGAHERGTSRLLDEKDEISLSTFLKDDKTSDNLPFLFKLLAAGSPLSIQVHPDKKQAEEGYRKENSQSIPLDAPNRNYKDDNHKPEIICALTPFWAMRGFRKIDKIIANFKKMELPSIAAGIDEFDRNRNSDGLRIFFNLLMALNGSEKKQFIGELVNSCSEIDEIQNNWVLKLYEKYPEDTGIAAPLYLNLVKLMPGQALYLAAGELHAYLDGLGMELMASSDNVLRGGLTPKHIDREELKRILNFSGDDPDILEPLMVKKGVYKYITPSEEFELTRINLREIDKFIIKHDNRIQIMFIGDGSVLFRSDSGEEINGGRGESFFIPADSGLWSIEGEAVLFRASIPGDDC